jgi:hypothetical protein
MHVSSVVMRTRTEELPMKNHVLRVLILALFACGGDDVLTSAPQRHPPVALTIVSGNNQEGATGTILAQPFTVRVTDDRGAGVAGVWVGWTLTSGGGDFWTDRLAGLETYLSHPVTLTDADGVTRVFFRPIAPGGIAVSAGVEGLPNSPLTFTAVSAPPSTDLPPVSPLMRIYVAVDSPFYQMHGSPLASRYVLFDDGSFALQYSSANYPFFEYRGTYLEANGLITFAWEGWSVAGPWGAIGSINENSLSVRYNVIMQFSDFEDGVFLRVLAR